MPEELKDLLASIIGELRKIAATETIVGKPVALGDKKVVPISRILVGFGVGGGEGKSKDAKQEFAGGGGGGARVEPVGFIVIDGEKVSFLPSKPGKFDEIIELVPDVIDKFVDRKKK
jgi:uncharacterized spore protein YtfJ